MANEYLLSLSNRTVQTITRTPATSAISGTLSLSAATNLVSPPLSGTTTVSNLSVAFVLTPTLASGVSATSTGISLTQGSSAGNVIVYGKVTTSTFVPSTSTVTATIAFNDPNYVTTNIDISARGTSAVALSTSNLDNPFYWLTADGRYPTYSVFGGLTSVNVPYRTVGRQVRLRQGYEA